MPVVPITKSKPTPRAPPPPDPTFLEIAAATMHKEGKLNLTPDLPNGAPSIPINTKSS